MASQAAIFAETIAGMKKAVKRKAYDSDSDSSIDQLTNRGNKLRKKARYVHEGQLAPPTGLRVYKRRIEHAGFQREIISRNPPLIDQDGYEVDSEDDDERAQAAAVAAAEFDPYAEVKIEHLLAPLTAAADLAEHPTLSRPFLSKTLTELTRHADEMVQKEKASLWRIKHLLTRLSGDHTWVPCESVETDSDFKLFGDERDRHRVNQLGKANAKGEGDLISAEIVISDDVGQEAGLLTIEADPATENVLAARKDDLTETPIGVSVAKILSIDRTIHANEASTSEAVESEETMKQKDTPETHNSKLRGGETLERDSGVPHEGIMEVDDSADPLPVLSLNGINGTQMQLMEVVDGVDAEAGAEDQGDLPAPHRMRTRAQAQAASDNTTSTRTRSMTAESSNESFVHPYFLAPQISHPDRDLGLPQHEAEETRRILQLYVQKQEEVCRGAQRVYEGLLKADRYRHLVMKWAKAEAHVGVNRDMSDGEDWYDKDEWGLDEELKKGQDEEEEDAATTAKKTRTRRQ